jgi:uncharacterized protein (TIGR02246 family)
MTTSRTCLMLALALGLAACGFQVAEEHRLTAQDEAAIRAVFERWEENVSANRFMENLDLLTEDAAELLANPRVGKPAIRERWEGIMDAYVFKTAEVRIVEIAGLGDVAYAWAEFNQTYDLRDQSRIQHGNMLAILRQEPDGSWRILRSSWMGAAQDDPAAAAVP